MKYSSFQAVCPFEIGDKIVLANGENKTITDIMTMHFVRDGKVQFAYELDNSDKYVTGKNKGRR